MLQSPEQLAYTDKLFQLRILKANGQAYEDLFTEVMTLRNPGFRPVKPQGQIGDRKNDGYSSQNGTYHQVYAPENADDNASKAISKISTDFAGLKSFWNSLCPVERYFFVINDKFKGTFPTVEAELLKLKKEHGLLECRPFLNSDLMRTFAELDARQVLQVVGHIPSPDQIPDLDYSIFTEVLNHVVADSTPLTASAILVVPDFNEKIEFNGISPQVAALLTTGNFQSGAVERYFSNYSGFSKQAIRDKLAAIYGKLKVEIYLTSQETKHPGDVIFFALLEQATPQPPKSHWQTAAIVLLSYFFESCDIYEDPQLPL